MKFGFFRRKQQRMSNIRGTRYTFRSIEQLEDRRLLTNAPPNLAAIANAPATTGTELVIQLNVTDAETAADQLFVFFDPDEMPVTNATIDNATKTFHWTPTTAQVGDFRFVILATDRPAGGSPALADAEEFTVTVAAANQPPVNTVPAAAQTTAEDTDLVFATASNNLISIADPDAATADVQVALAATNGTLTLSTITGLTFTVGDGTADAQATFTGSIAAINAALAGLKVHPQFEFFGRRQYYDCHQRPGTYRRRRAQTDTDTVTINVTPVADTPGVTHATTNEDTQTTSGLVITAQPSRRAGSNTCQNHRHHQWHAVPE